MVMEIQFVGEATLNETHSETCPLTTSLFFFPHLMKSYA